MALAWTGGHQNTNPRLLPGCSIRERFSERPSRKGRNIPKRLPLFTGLGRHPNSCERTRKEIRHDVQVGI
jgi:hypothetical protein